MSATVLLGCTAAPTPAPTPGAAPNAFAWEALPGWKVFDFAAISPALNAHCKHIAPRRALQDWQSFCAAVLAGGDLRSAVVQHLQVQLQGSEAGLATGYYEPVFNASLQPSAAFAWPLYAAPTTASTLARNELTPSPDRAHSSLQGRALAWLADPIDAYLVHVQGSTRLRLADGSIIRLAFAGSNGQAFTSVANALIRQGEFKAHEASNERLRAWARSQSPAQVQAVLNTNARFIFFKRDATPPEQGPAGALGAPLHALHSVAVDPAFTPLGGLIWLDTPALQQPGLKLAQDTGSAIKGAARVDIYYGTGDAAGDAAGKVKHPARVWLITPKI